MKFYDMMKAAALVGGGSSPSPTPTGADFTCDADYYFDTAVECSLNGNTRQKTNSKPAIGIIVHFMSGSYCNPIFISPDADAVRYFAGTTENTPAIKQVTYDGLKWFYSTEESGTSGNYTDALGNIKSYPNDAQWDEAARTISQETVLAILAYVNAAKK